MLTAIGAIIESITEIGSFLASVGVIAYVIRRVGDFLTWSFFIFLISGLGLSVIYNVYIESVVVRLLAFALTFVMVISLGINFTASQSHPPKD